MTRQHTLALPPVGRLLSFHFRYSPVYCSTQNLVGVSRFIHRSYMYARYLFARLTCLCDPIDIEGVCSVCIGSQIACLAMLFSRRMDTHLHVIVFL